VILVVSAPAPRHWLTDEVRCLQNVVARVWPAIKRARAIAALRAGEASLRASNHDLARFNRAAVGRELRMIELKREINEMCNQLGQPARYPLDFDNQP
jgi:two-component system CheB/CheR fusion protein